MRVDYSCETCGRPGHRSYAQGKVPSQPRNLVFLCKSCHTLVEYQQKLIYGIIPDWDVVQILVRERLHCL